MADDVGKEAGEVQKALVQVRTQHIVIFVRSRRKFAT